jgi:hypothetical protein
MVRDVQADGPPNSNQPKTVGQMDRNEDAQEHMTNTKNPKPTGSTRTVHAYQVDCPPGANRRGNSNPRANSQAPGHLSFHGSPRRLKLLRKGLGRCEASLGDAIPQNLGPQLNSNAGNRVAIELNQKPRFQPKSFNRSPNSEFGGSRSSTKMHEATVHDSHQQIRAQTLQNQRNMPRTKN